MSKSPLERPNHGESNDTVFVLFLRNRNRGCVSKANSRGKIPVAIPRFLLRERIKNTPSFDSPWFDLSYGAFFIVYSSLVTFLWLIHRDLRNRWPEEKALIISGHWWYRIHPTATLSWSVRTIRAFWIDHEYAKRLCISGWSVSVVIRQNLTSFSRPKEWVVWCKQ